ncbi:hypothetical protein ACP70R_015688 [Stipagrostis hirtigluma subsp. patula]
MSSQVDSRSQSAGKRARTDGGRREDGWVCPSCNNFNFAFHTTCNMRNCNQSRPADPTGNRILYLHRVKSQRAVKGPSAVHLIQRGIPQFPGGSAYAYGYSRHIPVGSPYGPMHMTGPPPYSGGSMMGSAGGMYSMPMDRYGVPLHAGPGAMGTRAGSYTNEGSQKKPAGAGRDNDWDCPNCHNINFAFRTVCNMRKCNTPRPENQGSKPDSSRGSKPKMPEGSWKCEQCNNINYPFRTKCLSVVQKSHCRQTMQMIQLQIRTISES